MNPKSITTTNNISTTLPRLKLNLGEITQYGNHRSQITGRLRDLDQNYQKTPVGRAFYSKNTVRCVVSWEEYTSI